MKKSMALIGLIVLLTTAPAFAQFSVDWGTSFDPATRDGYTMGYDYLADWLYYTYDPGHTKFSDFGAARIFAQTGYIGYNAGDADPFYFLGNLDNTVQVQQEIAGYQYTSTLGYYLMGNPSVKTQLFDGGQVGPTTFHTTSQFGFYLNTPNGQDMNNPGTWSYFYTDRTLNGNTPTALIYQLEPNKWLVAWEDIDPSGKGAGVTDRDYNDMYMTVTATPEPVSAGLFLLGGGALAFIRRKQRAA